MAIWFHSEYDNFKIESKSVLKKWIKSVICKKKYSVGSINYIFVNDEEILVINNKYLNHNFFTDIISFDYTDGKLISGDIYISIDRVKENAKNIDNSFKEELHRVIIHGILHYLGVKDKTQEEAKNMRAMENTALDMLKLS